MAKLVLAIIVAAAVVQIGYAGVDIEVVYKPESCNIQTQRGDTIKMHYRGTLTDGIVFDSTYARGTPIEFVLGKGKGWDEGLLGTCVGEKRKLRITPDYNYGASGYLRVIPNNAVLLYDTELISINGRYSADGGVASAL